MQNEWTLQLVAKYRERVYIIWAKVVCGEYHVTAVSLRHYERSQVNVRFFFCFCKCQHCQLTLNCHLFIHLLK
jgi:hypothetical protein